MFDATRKLLVLPIFGDFSYHTCASLPSNISNNHFLYTIESESISVYTIVALACSSKSIVGFSGRLFCLLLSFELKPKHSQHSEEEQQMYNLLKISFYFRISCSCL